MSDPLAVAEKISYRHKYQSLPNEISFSVGRILNLLLAVTTDLRNFFLQKSLEKLFVIETNFAPVALCQ